MGGIHDTDTHFTSDPDIVYLACLFCIWADVILWKKCIIWREDALICQFLEVFEDYRASK